MTGPGHLLTVRSGILTLSLIVSYFQKQIAYHEQGSANICRSRTIRPEDPLSQILYMYFTNAYHFFPVLRKKINFLNKIQSAILKMVFTLSKR